MNRYSPEFYKILLAIILFIFVFLTKLLVARTKLGKVEIIQAFIELPIGIFFLSISFLIAILLSVKLKDDAMPFICLVICFMVISLALAASWRRCQFLYDSSLKIGWVVFYLVLNFSVGIGGLYFSGTKLITSTQEAKTKTKSEINSNKK